MSVAPGSRLGPYEILASRRRRDGGGLQVDARALLITAWGRDFAVSGDGQRFLIVTSAGEGIASPITLVLRPPLP